MTRSRFLSFIFAGTFFLLTCSCVESFKQEEVLESTAPAYTIIVNAKRLNSTKCIKQLEELHEAILQRRSWSMKVLDSSGLPKSGFLYGNNFWLGKRSQCADLSVRRPLPIRKKMILNETLYRPPIHEYPPFEFRYFLATARHNSTMQYHMHLKTEDVIMLGLCLPASCTKEEIGGVLEEIFKNRTLLVNDLYKIDFNLLSVNDYQEDSRWLLTGGPIVVGLFVLVTILLMVAGTCYDVLKKKRKKLQKLQNCNNNNMTIQMTTKETPDEPEDEPVVLEPESVFGRIIKCFSLNTNIPMILNTKKCSTTVPAIHGIRFLGMLWIIMIHSVFYMTDTADNRVWFARESENFATQVITNATLSVDTFFLISGFLFTYLYFANKNNKKLHLLSYGTMFKIYLLYIAKRFIRLTPAYMIIIGLTQINYNWYEKSSTFYMSERPQDTCGQYWWRNLLYIQNFFPRSEMCMSWSWYLANDMQFFIICATIIMLTSSHIKVMIGTLITMMIGSMVISGYVSYIYGYVPTLDEQYNLLEQLYDPPWIRIGPYIVGVLTAFINYKLNNKLPLKKRTLVILWILFSSCNVVTLFGLFDKNMSVLASAFYTATSRTLWAIGIAWVIIACNTKHGGIVNKILSFNGWVPFSRMTYCAYLLNPPIISSVYLYNESAVHGDILTVAVLFLGNFLITFFVAFLFTLMFETPYMLLMKEFLQIPK